jgi:hypothetical protein
MEIVVDQEYDVYYRSVYTFTKVMGDIGGLFTAFKFVGWIINS